MGKQFKWTPPEEEAVDTTTTDVPVSQQQPWTPPAQDEVVEEPVKKKEQPESSVNLLPSSGLDEHGEPSGIPTVKNAKKLKLMQEAQQLREQTLQEKQSAQLTEMMKQKPLTEEESKRQFDLRVQNKQSAKDFLNPPKEANPLVTGGKSLWNVLSNQLPAAAASSIALAARDLREPGEYRLTSGTQAVQKETNKLVDAGRKELLNWAVARQGEGAEYTKNLVSHLDEINDPLDAINYAFNAVGQATAQIPTTVATGGASSVMQEVGDTYLTNIQRIAKDKGLTINEVMDKNLDEPLIAVAYGGVAAALDKIGADKVLGAFGKKAFGQSMRARAKDMVVSGVTESMTEYMQTGIEQIAEEKAAGKTLLEAAKEVYSNPEKKAERREAFAQGGIGGAGLSITGHASPKLQEAIRPNIDAVDVNNPASLDQAAAAIAAKVEAAPEPQQATQETTDTTEEPVARGAYKLDTSNEPITPTEDASTIREDQGSVPQGGEIPERSQIDRGGDVQSETQGAPVNGETVEQTQGEVKRQYKIAERILDSDANEQIKAGIKEKGDEYVPKKIDITDKEAKDLIDLYGTDKSESLIRDSKNDLSGDTRTALTARLYEKYKSDADAATDPVLKQQLNNKAVDIAMVGAEQAKEAGRAVNANKIWKLITSDEDSLAIAMEKQNKASVSKYVAPVQKKLTKTKAEFDEEVRKMIAQKVTEGVETQLARAKLITKEKRQQISKSFDDLKVSTKGVANDITRVVGAAVWNGAVEATKRAVLAGADIANAIQAGIDHITTHYKGQDFKPEEYAAMMQPRLEALVPKAPVSAETVEKAVKVPGLTGKKKKDFISSVVDEYNKSGAVSDERFEELYAKQIGYREYTDEERAKIRELAKIIVESEKFADVVKNDFTKENIAKHQDLLNKAKKANQDLQEFARQPAQIADTFIAMMQGNLLTPLSVVTNVYSNAALQPLRFVSTGIGSIIDRTVNTLARMGLLDKSYRDPTIDLVALQKGYVSGLWDGAQEGLKQLKEGQTADERDLREIQSSFSPSRAIKRWADSDRQFDQKVNDAIEGTFGWPAEAMFRLLNLGDKPFRRAAEKARAIEIGERRGLKGDDLLKFVMFPDESAQNEIDKAGKEATFQQETKLSKFVQTGLTKFLNLVGEMPVVGGLAKVVLKSQVPYVKTPLNIVIETFDYALPLVTLYRGVQEMRHGDRRRGQVLIGKAIVGGIILSAANALFKLGILSWEDDKDKKGRNIQYDTVPPNSLNVDALSRGLVSGDFSIQNEDSWVNYKKMGIVGIIFDNYSNAYYKAEKEGKDSPGLFTEFVNPANALNLASASLEQSFLKGTNSLLNAIQDRGGYETEQWAIETTGALSSTLYPNTIATVSKSGDEFIRDTYNRDFGERLKATYKAKMFMGGDLPAKVNLWGEKVRGNPEGRNKYVYYLFDPTKFKNVDTDSYKYKLYEAWKGDNFNNKWLPSAPDRSENVKGVNMKLSPKEFALLSTYVGQERARAVQAYVNSSWKHHSKEKRLERLHDIYSDAAKRGKKKFLMETGWSALNKKKLEEINQNR